MIKYFAVKYKLVLLLVILIVHGCSDSVTDFGFEGNISGKITDQDGNIVSGDVTAANLLVSLLGEEETLSMDIRVLGDGTFANTHLYPQTYTFSLQGAIMPVDDFAVDLTGGPVIQNITVTPFLTLPTPTVNVSGDSVSVGYNIIENEGKIADQRIIYVSTVQYPSQSTGSGAYWRTISRSVGQNQGEETITGLDSGSTYYVRIAARAEGSTMWNFSDHVRITTP